MTFTNDDLLDEFITESNEHLADIEHQLLTIESAGRHADDELVNQVFRAIHTVKGASGFLGLETIGTLAHHMENVLNRIRNHQLEPSSPLIDTLLRAADQLRAMIAVASESNGTNVSGLVHELAQYDESTDSSQPAAVAGTDPSPHATEHAHLHPHAAPSVAPPARQIDQPTDTFDAGRCALPVAADAAATPAPDSENQSCDTQFEDSADMASATATSEVSSIATTSGPTDAASGNGAPATDSRGGATTIRVPVVALDRLMNLAGELVLGRNRLLQATASGDNSKLETITTSVDQVTSELQEAIMRVRMQPIGSVFGRFSRIVRDLAIKLGKQCDLTLEGTEVEIDKSIVEAITDPLTHLVRNALDHGIETPDVRRRHNKPPAGTLALRADQQAGKVRIEIQDDGGGIDPARLKAKALDKGLISADEADRMSDREALRLIFHPGFSTAAVVSDLSGRGVGMDVVRTNIERLGGTVDVESQIGAGTTICIWLPLTLAIVPSMIVRSGAQKYAIPQLGIVELVRVRPDEVASRIGRVKGADVLRLRGSLVPLVHLEGVLREASAAISDEASIDGHAGQPRATHIILVETSHTRYGLVVDAIYDSEEIVVKPVGRHLKSLDYLAGATILGDGSVALILDVGGIAARADLSATRQTAPAEHLAETAEQDDNTQAVLLFQNAPGEHFAVPMAIVSRIERTRAEQVEAVGDQLLVQFRGRSVPVIALEDRIGARPRVDLETLHVVVFQIGGREVGLIAPQIRDIRDVSTDVDEQTLRERGVIGSLVVEGQVVRLLDVFELAEMTIPQWSSERRRERPDSETSSWIILLAEDSGFFRKQVASFLEGEGYTVVQCADGLEAWHTLESAVHDVDLVITDIEMPNLNGFDLCRRIRQSERFAHMPVIALTSLAGEEDLRRGQESGVDDYQVKMDREQLLAATARVLSTRCGPRAAQLEAVLC